MKKLLYWVLFLPFGLLIVVANILRGICEWVDQSASKFERWCFNDDKFIV